MYQIEVFGQASQKVIKTIQIELKDSRSLLEVLRSESLAIASSCLGAGKCMRCIINNDYLSCQLTFETFLATLTQSKQSLDSEQKIRITIGYL